MRILITGINGFVGRYLAQELAAKKHEVYGLDTAALQKNTFKADLRSSKEVLEVVQAVQPDEVFHLAGISKAAEENAKEIYEINVNGTLNLLLACSALKALPRFLFASSSQVYGNVPAADQPIAETRFFMPVNHYGASKAAAENLIMAFHHEKKLPVCILRPFNHTGPGQSPFFLIPKLVQAFKKKHNPIILGNLNVTRDFTDVRDIANIYACFVENFPNGETFNIGSGIGYTLTGVIEILKSLTGFNPEIVSSPDFMRPNDISYAVGNNGKLTGVLNKNLFHYDLRTTLKDMLNEC